MIDLLETVREELVGDEGLRLSPYRCPAGHLTIGVGHNLDAAGISTRMAMAILDEDVFACIADLQTFPWFASLNGPRTLAVINLRFNLGSAGLRTFTKFLAALDARDYVTAGDELVNSAWYHQVQRSRSTRIVRQIRDGV